MLSDALPHAARAGLYRLCADLLSREVELARLGDLHALNEALASTESDLGAWFESADEKAVGALRVEFARLFLLPGGVSPHASAWLEGEQEMIAGQIAALTYRAMAALDLEQTEPVGALSLDHLGLLYSVASHALDSKVPERVAVGEHVEREALGDWVVAFGTALAQQSREPLYRALGSLIREMHTRDRTSLLRRLTSPSSLQASSS